MNDEVVQEVLDRLDHLGELSGQGFEILVRQVYVEAVRDIVWALILFTLVVIATTYLRRCGYLGGEQRYHLERENDRYDDTKSISSIVAGLLGALFLMIGLVATTNVVTKLINPEFYAIRYIVRSLS